MTNFIYPFPPLLAGILIKRYKRFLADIELETGEKITAHCANPGKMLGLSEPGFRVMVSRSDNPKRKLPYSLELVEAKENEPTWVGVNTSLPNQVIKVALQQHLFPQLGDYTTVKPEVRYGQENKSRIDFLLTGNESDRPIYVEVKNVTWADGRIARFPDAVTTRGQKHLSELMGILPAGGRAVTLYFINRSDCTHFAPGDSIDPVYGQKLREAIASGMEIFPCRFEPTPQGVRFLGWAELLI
jgi:sugar fermentation stimulation protein A